MDDVVRDRPCGDDVGVDHFWSLALAWVWLWLGFGFGHSTKFLKR